jgi:hypothetical protein
MCPKDSHGSYWSTIGCKRGTLRNEIPLITLYPKLDPSSQLVRPWSPSGLGSDLEAEKLEREANRSLHQATQRRQKLLQHGVYKDSEVSAFLASLGDR